MDKFIGVASFTNLITETITRNKILRFLSKVNPKVDNQIIEEINNSDKYRNTVGTTLLELIDRMDSEVKPEILGNLFNSFSKKEISYPTLLKAAHILNMVFYIDLIHLKESYDGEYITSSVDASLSTYGLDMLT